MFRGGRIGGVCGGLGWRGLLWEGGRMSARPILKRGLAGRGKVCGG